MRVFAGFDGALAIAELDHHLEFLTEFLAHLGQHPTQTLPVVTLILRSPDSLPAQALIEKHPSLLAASVTAKAIVANPEPQESLRQLFEALSALSPKTGANSLIRWAKNGKLLEAHEQATYGARHCWFGDAMRRESGKRNALSLFHSDQPEAVRTANLAFRALWEASLPVPQRWLADRPSLKPSAAFEELSEAPLALSLLRPVQGWPLVRH